METKKKSPKQDLTKLIDTLQKISISLEKISINIDFIVRTAAMENEIKQEIFSEAFEEEGHNLGD